MSPGLNAEICVDQAPAPQMMIDLLSGWSSRFPDSVGVTAGAIPLFEDGRVVWALDRLGGAVGKTVLELGPLEGGHTYMLSRAGAAHVTAIEANRNAFLRCLISREIMAIERASFLYGDFLTYLEHTQERFDIVLASGVLYHMANPTRLLQLIAKVAGSVFLWTHYVPDDGYDPEAAWAKGFTIEDRIVNGRPVRHHLRAYEGTTAMPIYCGGIHHYASRLRRADILAELAAGGLSDVEVAFEDERHPFGPCFALVARRTDAS